MVVAAASLTRGSAIAAVAVPFSRWRCRWTDAVVVASVINSLISCAAVAVAGKLWLPVRLTVCRDSVSDPLSSTKKNLCAELDCSGCIQVAARETHTAAAKK